MAKLTLALSVYNVAEYVRASMESILSQSFADYELLCIDDASIDGTWDILLEYAQQDKRIRLLRNPNNLGLSVSRNRAIDEAKGEYLLMLDGDDLFAPDMVEKAYNKAIETDSDMVIWDYLVFYDEDAIPNEYAKESRLLNIDVKDKIQLLRRPAFSPCRLVRTSVLKSLEVRFPEGLTKQDIPVHWKLVTSLDKVSIIPERMLFYRQHRTSTTSKKDESVFSLAYVMDITKQQLMDDEVYELYKNEFLRSRLSLLHGMYDYVRPDLKEEALAIVEARLGGDEIAYIHEPSNELSYYSRWFYLSLEGNKMAHMKYLSYRTIRSIYRKLR